MNKVATAEKTAKKGGKIDVYTYLNVHECMHGKIEFHYSISSFNTRNGCSLALSYLHEQRKDFSEQDPFRSNFKCKTYNTAEAFW